jgi:chemotaxis signal transduction protein
MTTNQQQVYIEDINETADEEMIQLVGFKLGDEEYAIDVLKIQEIIRIVEITTVPRMEPFVLGVMNLRGKVIPVIDLRVRFNLYKSDFDKKTRIIVVKFEKENIGFVVDEVTEVARINKSMVEPTPPLVGSIGQEYILGICKYDDRLIILLDIDRVVYEGDNYVESDLRKRFYKTDDNSKAGVIEMEKEHAEEEPEPVKEEVVKEKDEKKEEPETVADSIHEMVAETMEEEDDDRDELDDIDALIAQELAKREKETEELLAKKKQPSDNDDKDDKENIDDVLADALNQAESTISSSAEHIDQDDLDALIAQELALREKETEEMLARKKEE